MKIERISENKIRVFVTFDDLEERDIDLDTFNYNSPETQELFWDLMEQAEIEFGFNTTEAQLCIEAVSDIDQGFVITITKIDNDGEFESIQKFIKNKYKKNELKLKQKASKLCSTISIYVFENFEDLCHTAKNINMLYKGDSSLYKLENMYYLVLNNIEDTIIDKKLFTSIMSEFSSKATNDIFLEGYLNEYSIKMIAHNSIGILANYFN